MTKSRFLLSAVIMPALAVVAFAADVTGTWTATFDTQVGAQKYTYTFKAVGNKLTGKAKSELAGTETEIAEGTVNGDDLKLTRTILDMVTEEAVAQRVK